MVTQDSIVTATDYLGRFQYVTSTGSVTKLAFFPTAEGYVEPTETGGYQYVYNYTDHLANIRLSYTFDTTTSSLQIREENNYYPFGLKQKGYNNETVNSEYKYKYNGKELQDELGLNVYNYGARMYDPATGRWYTVDVFAEKYLDHSTYAYAMNNPVLYIDPDGNAVEMCCDELKSFLRGVRDGFVGSVSTVKDKVVNANRVANGMIEVYDKADKTTGGNGISYYEKTKIYVSRYVKEFGDYHSANDVAVLTEGRNLSGEKASKMDYGFAAAAVVLPISGKKLKSLLGGGLETLTKIFNKTSNQALHLDAKHISAAVGDILGNPITIDGKTYDHLDEVQNALNGLGNQLDQLNKQIDAGTFSDEVLDAAQDLRSSLQKQKDEITDILNRAFKKANE